MEKDTPTISRAHVVKARRFGVKGEERRVPQPFEPALKIRP
jgi:hypothetical protein